MKKKVSIIIRTRDEERWIAQTLKGVFSQSYTDFEVILVDNESSDKTIEKAKQFKIAKVIICKEYLPGKAINMGIRESTGEYIVCLSGHCIPRDENWLGNLVKNFDDPKIAGVYGRQEPMAFTSDADKRDLALVFGLDKKVQIKDSFFHNANSIINREVWNKFPFSETVTNIEDRVWAKEVLENGYKIIYEPEASVYHYHGINQNGNVQRCANVVRILESLNLDNSYKSIDMKKMNVVAIIPVRGRARYLGDKPLLAYTAERALQSKCLKRIIVSTDNMETVDLAKGLNLEAPFIRDSAFSDEHIDLAQVYKHSLEKIEEAKIFPDLVVCLEETFPFRPKGMIDDMILKLTQGGFDSVVAVRAENRAIWRKKDNQIEQLIEGNTPRKFKEPSFVELQGVGCVTHPEFLRKGDLLGDMIGMYEIDNPYSHLEVRDHEDFKMASLLIKEFF